MIASLARTEKIDVPLLGKVPRGSANMQDVPLHAHDCPHALVAVEAVQRPVGDIEHDPPRGDVALRAYLLGIPDFFHDEIRFVWLRGTDAGSPAEIGECLLSPISGHVDRFTVAHEAETKALAV
jgi:hypothetical protein